LLAYFIQYNSITVLCSKVVRLWQTFPVAIGALPVLHLTCAKDSRLTVGNGTNASNEQNFYWVTVCSQFDGTANWYGVATQQLMTCLLQCRRYITFKSL